MTTVLDRIVGYKRQEIERARDRVSVRELEQRVRDARPVRDFRAALDRAPGMAVIAEVKRASPSAGVLREDFDPVAVARGYPENGAACVSVLTDAPSFQGEISHLGAISADVPVPALRREHTLNLGGAGARRSVPRERERHQERVGRGDAAGGGGEGPARGRALTRATNLGAKLRELTSAVPG